MGAATEVVVGASPAEVVVGAETAGLVIDADAVGFAVPIADTVDTGTSTTVWVPVGASQKSTLSGQQVLLPSRMCVAHW
jgi:hypothetical protein